MKKIVVFLILIALVLVGVACTNEPEFTPDGPAIDFTPERKEGAISAFALLAPANDAVFTSVPVFTWEAAENAETYTIEICTSPEFVEETLADADQHIYNKEIYFSMDGLTSPQFKMTANLKKDTTYYWRVTAVNADHWLYCADGNEGRTFTYNALEEREMEFSVGYADEWKVHEVGSKATVTVDRNDFFKTGNESLKVSFDREDTQRGEEYVESNGWVVVTRSLETEIYGPDAFYFNFFYAGNDATAFFRLIDEDNEYWYAPIKLAQNAKQTIIIHRDEFVLRTNGTPVVNGEFDYHYIRSVELVFEHVDGDGAAFFSDLRAITYADYADYFIDAVNFDRFADKKGVEGEYFDFTTETADGGNTLTYSFTTKQVTDENKVGYGFVTYDVNKILSKGDAFAFTVNVKELKGDDEYNFQLRVVEEDKDIWVFSLPKAEIPESGVVELLIPYSAFRLAEGGFKGDGIRQFYYLKQVQFGLNNYYQDGSITVSGFSVDSLVNTLGENLYTVTVGEDGMIESFEAYKNSIDVYYKWEPSTENKDESITLIPGENGGKAAQFGYKSDLPAASYRVNFAPVTETAYNAISITAKDVSIDGADATMIVYLHTAAGELYSFTMDGLLNSWREYKIPLSMFSLDENSAGIPTITSERIAGISVAFQYYYPKSLTNLNPAKYNSGNYVYVDAIKFINK